LEAKRAEKTDQAPDVDDVDPAAGASQVGGDAFGQAAIRQEGALPEAPTGDGGGSVNARLQALGLRPDSLIKTAAKDKVRIVETPLGKVLEGSIHAETAAGLSKLQGVVRITGDLTIAESLAKSPDLIVLRSLVELGGRLAVEGSAAIQVLDQLEALERARSVYLGFNRALSKVEMRSLKELAGAFIVEANPAVREILLPKLEKVGRYLHLHENPALNAVDLRVLEMIVGELSLVGNTALKSVQVGKKDKPVTVGGLELSGNAQHSYAQMFIA
jgi:hypothetical protein